MKKLIALFSLFLSFNLAYANQEQNSCGKINFLKSLSCDSPKIDFDITSCDQSAPPSLPATKAFCENGEMFAELEFNNQIYKATLVKYLEGHWAQKGNVFYSKLKNENNSKATKVTKQPLKKSKKIEQVSDKPDLTSKTAHEEIKKEAKVEIVPEKTNQWKLDFLGWFTAEQEMTQNFSDQVTNNFDSKDAKSDQSNTNILSNFQFSLSKQNIKFESLLEVGEVFYGDSTTGGEQGLRGKIIELRNFYAEQTYEKNWSSKVGLWTVNADPRGFILSDHYAGAQIKRESEKTASQLWYARAVESHPPAADKVRDTYFGLSHLLKINDKLNYNFFGVYRSTKESFYDENTAANLFGLSNYYWLGVNSVQGEIFSKTNLEYNLILNQSQFTSDGSGVKDSNNSWLVHARLDHEIDSSWSLGFDLLATSGSSDGQVGGAAILGKRKGFASPNPGQSYLLTIATSDSGDDAAGSLRTTTGTILQDST